MSCHDLGMCTFLSLPVEIRLRVYTLLFRCAETLLIEPANPAYQQQEFDDDQGVQQETLASSIWQMRMSPIQFCRPAYLTRPVSDNSWGLGLSSQLLVVCRRICTEALPILYSINRFDCSMRSAPTVLSHVISAANFARIRHLILDWEQLQDFAWSLAKDEQVHATRGLEVLEVNHFRTRVLQPRVQEERLGILPNPSRGWLFEDTRSHERQLHQAALEICQKHAQLRHVLQATSHKSLPRAYQCEEVPESHGHGLSWPIPELKVTARIRWRFVTEKGLRDRKENETVLDLTSELTALAGPFR